MGHTGDEQIYQEIRGELRAQWIEAVVLAECTPEQACEQVGIPYPLMLAYKDRDPKIAALWDYQAERALQKERLAGATPQTFRDVAEIQSNFTKSLFERAGLGTKITRYVEKIDPETAEGEEKLEKLIKFGLLKQVLPSQTVSHQPKRDNEVESMSTGELLAKVKERQAKVDQYLQQHEAAKRARERHAGLIEEGDVHEQ